MSLIEWARCVFFWYIRVVQCASGPRSPDAERRQRVWSGPMKFVVLFEYLNHVSQHVIQTVEPAYSITRQLFVLTCNGEAREIAVGVDPSVQR